MDNRLIFRYLLFCKYRRDKVGNFSLLLDSGVSVQEVELANPLHITLRRECERNFPRKWVNLRFQEKLRCVVKSARTVNRLR